MAAQNMNREAKEWMKVQTDAMGKKRQNLKKLRQERHMMDASHVAYRIRERQ